MEGYAFPALCVEGWEEEEAEIVGLPPSPAPLARVALFPKHGKAGADSSEPDCYAAPGDPACVDFRQPDATSREQLGVLCDAMPGMVGCTLWAACKVRWGWRGSSLEGGGLERPCMGSAARTAVIYARRVLHIVPPLSS
jgi:hypothetical protein